MKHSKNIILTDCEAEEIATFSQGVEEASSLTFEIVSEVSNKLHGSKWKTIRRYLKYFTFPLRIALTRRDAAVVLGWQQFYAINYAFFCRLLGLKRRAKVVAVNFTYKRKGGVLGRLYRRYMRYAVSSDCITGLHVLSNAYANQLSSELDIPRDRFWVTRFGTPDRSEQWKKLTCEHSGFALAIGRSNRDFDFLARVWQRPEIVATGKQLIIISDTWAPEQPIAAGANILHLTNVKGDASFPYFVHCDFQIVPIADGGICSGDTVLINSMMMSHPVVVTAPSTLQEMYITHGVDGLCISKNEAEAAAALLRLIGDPALCRTLGTAARRTYETQLSRTRMGLDLGAHLASV